jgi:predicted phosphodiesterase
MQIREPIRIISDLHLGHPASLIDHPASLAPLLHGVGTLVFNGDSAEMRYLKEREAGRAMMEKLGELCRSHGVDAWFINGNHDPVASSTNHLDLSGGAVLVTHGDMLFHDISPWSIEADLMGAAHTQALEELDDAAFADFEKRLNASKRASIALELVSLKLRRGRLARLAVLLKECWPPTRPWRILKVWKQTPDRAEALARVFRPRARFIIIGHTHYQGIWRRGPRVVINTGSFTPPLGRLAVDLEGNRLQVKIIAFKKGRFEIGRTRAQFETSRLQAHEGF